MVYKAQEWCAFLMFSESGKLAVLGCLVRLCSAYIVVLQQGAPERVRMPCPHVTGCRRGDQACTPSVGFLRVAGPVLEERICPLHARL